MGIENIEILKYIRADIDKVESLAWLFWVLFWRFNKEIIIETETDYKTLTPVYHIVIKDKFLTEQQRAERQYPLHAPETALANYRAGRQLWDTNGDVW